MAIEHVDDRVGVEEYCRVVRNAGREIHFHSSRRRATVRAELPPQRPAPDPFILSSEGPLRAGAY
jgi:hypothetical protein